MSQAINNFIDGISRVKVPGAFNFYSQAHPANAIRRNNLKLYFEEIGDLRPKVLLLGEAPGYQGTRLTGVPFTSEYLMLRGIEKLDMLGAHKGYQKTDEFERVYKEPTATIMWQVLESLNFVPLLWAAFPFHPHKPSQSLSNRAPTRAEVEIGKQIFQELKKLFDIREVVAVGNVAHSALAEVGVDTLKVRHPSHGGKRDFADQLAQYIRRV